MDRRRGLLLGLVAMLCAGCTTAPAVKLVDRPVPIESIDSVRGDWTGRIVKSPVGPREDWIDVTIGGDGSYRFTAYRTHSMLAGSGQLILVAGELRSESTSGTATYRLYDRAGTPLLKIEALERTGLHYVAELKPRARR
jgi:hypothetical protein